MIQLGDLIAPDGIVFDLAATTKADILDRLAVLAAGLARRDAGEVTRVIHDREALGSTGFGAGTAIPHGRLPDLSGIVAVAARLATPVAYAALDGLPVDLVILMLAPSGAGADHLKALARISRAMRDVAFCTTLRGAGSPDAFYDILAGARRSEAA